MGGGNGTCAMLLWSATRVVCFCFWTASDGRIEAANMALPLSLLSLSLSVYVCVCLLAVLKMCVGIARRTLTSLCTRRRPKPCMSSVQ